MQIPGGAREKCQSNYIMVNPEKEDLCGYHFKERSLVNSHWAQKEWSN